MRSKSPCSSVENTGTRPSNSTTSVARIPAMAPGIITAQLAGGRGYLEPMGPITRSIAPLLALVLLLTAPATSGASTAAQAQVSSHSLVQSRQLWATIDLCNPPDQPHYVGVRGSMPGDGRATDTMYMRFRLQYASATTGQWTDIAKGPAP